MPDVRPLGHLMRTATTTRCRQFGRPEISISYSDHGALPEDAEALASSLEEMVASGSCFEPGQTIQIGWLYGEFRADGPDRLTVYEPDLEGFPVSWSRGVTNILTTKRLLLDVADSFGLRDQAAFPSLRHSCLHCTAFADRPDFFMSRFDPQGHESGWFIGCPDTSHDHNDPANLRCISTYELVTCISRRPLMYLALPPDIVVQISNDVPHAGLPDRPLRVAAHSFLATLHPRAV